MTGPDVDFGEGVQAGEKLYDGHGGLLADAPDYLCQIQIMDYCFPLEPAIATLPLPGQELSLMALQLPGWKRLVDNLTQRSLSSLPVFPAFLQKLKACVSLLRNDLNQREACRSLVDEGFPGVALIVGRLKSLSSHIGGGVHWTTCAQCSTTSWKRLCSDPTPRFFVNKRDGVEFQRVQKALSSPQFYQGFQFVHNFAWPLTSLHSWGGGGHGVELSFDQKIDCPWKGRSARPTSKRSES